MKKNFYFVLATAILLLFNCGGDDEDIDPIYRQYMRDFVEGLSTYAKSKKNNFIIIPQNGQELVSENGEEDGSPDLSYLQAIDGAGREDLFYGYDDDDKSTPTDERDYMISYLTICRNNNVKVLVTDYCWTHSKMDDSYLQNENHEFISFAAPDRELRKIPDYPSLPNHMNLDNITSLSNAKNFLYLLNPEEFLYKQDFLNALAETNYDVLIIDYFFDEEEFTNQEITTLKHKKNGGTRLVIAYLSIGEAEDYRYYWNEDWYSNPPSWLRGENPDWEGNYKVEYWDAGWQNIIYGNSNAYLDKIIAKGFDGAYLDIIDAFEYFE